MIKTKKELIDILKMDALANNRTSLKVHNKTYDIIWYYIVCMRKCDFYNSRYRDEHNKYLRYLKYKVFKRIHLKWKKLSIRLGITMGYSNIGGGFSIVHYGCIAINGGCVIGKNFRVHEGVCVGSTSGSNVPIIGDNVFVGSGAKIIGNIRIANDVQIGANAVVVKSIEEPGTTWAGVPAKKISNNNSSDNIRFLLKK